MEKADTHTESANVVPNLTEQELLEKLAQHERTIKELRWKLWRYEFLVSKTAVIANYLTLGPGLTHAMERWERAFVAGKGSLMNRVPRRETFEVAAAYMRRRAISGLAIGLLAVIPSALTLFLLWQQNKKIDLQILMASANQARENQVEVSLLAADLKNFAETACIPAIEMSKHLVLVSGLERKRDDPTKWDLPFSACWSDQRMENAIARRNWLEHRRGFTNDKVETLEEFNFGERDSENIYQSDFLPAEYLLGLALPLSRDLQQRVTTLSTALRPYRMMLDKAENDQSPRLTRNLYSPEKGSLLRALGTNALNVSGLNAAQAWAPATHLTDLTWRRTSLANAMMECANFTGGVFTNADFSGGRFVLARFDYADLQQVSGWSDADFTHASFRGAILPAARLLNAASMEGVDLSGAIVPSDNWHQELPTHLAADVGRAQPGQEKAIEYSYEPLLEHSSSVDYRLHKWVMKRNYSKDWRPLRDAQCSRRVSEGFRIE